MVHLGAVRNLSWNPRFSGLEDYFRVARNPPRIDAKRGEHFLRADLDLSGVTGANASLGSANPTLS
jgi:hypothetical protein